MGVTPRDQVVRRFLHQLRNAPEALRVLADAFDEHEMAEGPFDNPGWRQADLRRWADAIENLRVLVPEALEGR